MKLILALVAALTAPSSVHGCWAYLYCHCYDHGGAPNDEVTKKVCGHYSDGVMIDANQWSDGAKECHYAGETSYLTGKATYYIGWGNCDWRKLCADEGATGKDSSCRDGPPPGHHRGSAIAVRPDCNKRVPKCYH